MRSISLFIASSNVNFPRSGPQCLVVVLIIIKFGCLQDGAVQCRLTSRKIIGGTRWTACARCLHNRRSTLYEGEGLFIRFETYLMRETIFRLSSAKTALGCQIIEHVKKKVSVHYILNDLKGCAIISNPRVYDLDSRVNVNNFGFLLEKNRRQLIRGSNPCNIDVIWW
jgi:hypothetical protein